MLNLHDLYYEINKYIKLIDFNKLWDGFKPLKFALYNDKECFFNGEYIEKTNEFLANTSIIYKGEAIAIWNVNDNIDSITLTSKMVHEMFHGFQMINNESRFPNEIDALYKYKYNDDNLSIKLNENKILVELIEDFDLNKFNKFLALRKYRYTKHNYEYIYESNIEQIEGTANYIELNVLKQLSSKLYITKLNEMKNNIVDPLNMLPIRVVSYDIGAILLTILKDNNINFNSAFSVNSFSLDIILNANEIVLDDYLCMNKYIINYNKESERIINKAILKNNVIVDKSVDLIGVNVYNARYYNNHIISTYFVMYMDNGTQIIKYGDFVIESLKVAKGTKIYQL